MAQALDGLGLKELQPEPTSIDFNRLAMDAVYRRPPFSPGDSEKGFRDALIVEAIVQLHQDESGKDELFAVVSGDDLLVEAINQRLGASGNVRCLSSLEELSD